MGDPKRIYITEAETTELMRQSNCERPIDLAFGMNRVWLTRTKDGHIASLWALTILVKMRGIES